MVHLECDGSALGDSRVCSEGALVGISLIVHASSQSTGHPNDTFETYTNYLHKNGTDPNHGGECFLITLPIPWSTISNNLGIAASPSTNAPTL